MASCLRDGSPIGCARPGQSMRPCLASLRAPAHDRLAAALRGRPDQRRQGGTHRPCGAVHVTTTQASAELAKRELIERGFSGCSQLAVGFRDVLVHEYTDIDCKIVMQVMRNGTRDFADFGKAILKMLDEF